MRRWMLKLWRPTTPGLSEAWAARRAVVPCLAEGSGGCLIRARHAILPVESPSRQTADFVLGVSAPQECNGIVSSAPCFPPYDRFAQYPMRSACLAPQTASHYMQWSQTRASTAHSGSGSACRIPSLQAGCRALESRRPLLRNGSYIGATRPMPGLVCALEHSVPKQSQATTPLSVQRTPGPRRDHTSARTLRPLSCEQPQ